MSSGDQYIKEDKDGSRHLMEEGLFGDRELGELHKNSEGGEETRNSLSNNYHLERSDNKGEHDPIHAEVTDIYNDVVGEGEFRQDATLGIYGGRQNFKPDQSEEDENQSSQPSERSSSGSSSPSYDSDSSYSGYGSSSSTSSSSGEMFFMFILGSLILLAGHGLYFAGRTAVRFAGNIKSGIEAKVEDYRDKRIILNEVKIMGKEFKKDENLELFNNLDLNKDGNVTKYELKGFEPAFWDIARAIDSYNSDKVVNGFMGLIYHSFDYSKRLEYPVYMDYLNSLVTERQERALKKINAQKLAQKRAREHAKRGLNEITLGYHNSNYNFVEPVLTKKEFPELFKVLDLDKDGIVTKEEVNNSKERLINEIQIQGSLYDGIKYFIVRSKDKEY